MRDDEETADALSRRLVRLLEAQRYEQAFSLGEQALGKHPDSAELLVNMASVLMKLERAAKAETYVARAAALRPDSPVIWNNFGLALRNQNRVAEALQCFEKAIALDPDFARGHYDRAFALLLAGSYEEGFREYEHRWAANEVKRPGDDDSGLRALLWRGQDPKGKRMLLYAEQGFGDTVQFARYVAPLVARGARVILEVQPGLRGLLKWLRPECEVGRGDGAGDFDFHCPLMTLPLNFGATVDTVPAAATFAVPEGVQAKWRELVGSDGFKVGLVWAGNPENQMDERRSTRLSTFHPLLCNEGLRSRARFFGFQVGPRASEIADNPHRETVLDLSPELGEATETAAALLQMNLLITVDTFVAHLAASLRIPVWVMLPYAPDWRWMLGRDDSPWYPTIRLFRQSAAGDWAGVAARMREALHELLREYYGLTP